MGFMMYFLFILAYDVFHFGFVYGLYILGEDIMFMCFYCFLFHIWYIDY